MTVWERLIGQPQAAEALHAAATDAAAFVRGEAGPGAMTHAWLITGPPGSGRSLAATAFAAALLCDSAALGQAPGCGGCPGCARVLGGMHEDVLTVATEGLSIGVDVVRSQLIPKAAAHPQGGRWRVIVVEDADRLIGSSEAAANALLKTLEEPAARTVFLLCAPSTEDLLPTIVSRCRRVTLHQPPVRDVAAVLVAEGVDPAMANWAARASQGHVGRARRLAGDPDARDRRRAVLELPTRIATLPGVVAAVTELAAAAKEEADKQSAARNDTETTHLKASLGVTGGRGGTPRGAAGALSDLEKRQKSRATRTQRDELDRALVDLAALYRDVLARQLGVAERLAVHADQTATVAKLARSGTPERTLRRIDAVLAARVALEGNANPQTALEAMALALR